MLSTPQAKLGQKPMPPVRKLEPVKAGDTGFALPFPADYTDEADILRHKREMADLKARVDAENARIKRQAQGGGGKGQ